MSIKGMANGLLMAACLCIAARAQLAINIQASGPPVGSCSNSVIYTNSANGDFYNCVVGAWHKVSPSTSGTVTSFSAGTLSPLFTTSVATATTTPALTFALSNAAANTIFGNFTGSSGAPSYNAVGPCGDSTHALAWTAGTGFTCQAISAGSGTVSNIATTSPITGGPITTTGTIACATCAIGPGSSTANHLAKFSGTDGVTLADGGAIPAGTVTSIATTSPIGGGTITGSGTLTCTTCVTSAAALTSGQLVAGAGSQAAAVTNLTGDVTTSGGVATTLASTAVTPGSYTNTNLTVNAKGLITAASNGAAGASCTGVGNPGLCLIEEHTASTSAALAFTSCLTSTYSEYMLVIDQLVPATNAVGAEMLVSTNGGSSYDTTAGHYAWEAFTVTASASGIGGSTSDSKWIIDGVTVTNGLSSTATNGGLNGTYYLFNPLGGASQFFFRGTTSMIYQGDGSARGNNVSGRYTQTTAVNAFEILMTSGNIASGTVRCYGVSK